MSGVGHRIMKTNQVGYLQGGLPGERGSWDRGVGDEAGTVSQKQRGESDT